MGKYNLIDEINSRVLKAITPDMKYNERRELRAKITDEVIVERAKHAGLDPDVVRDAWGNAAALGQSFVEIQRKLGL